MSLSRQERRDRRANARITASELDSHAVRPCSGWHGRTAIWNRPVRGGEHRVYSDDPFRPSVENAIIGRKKRSPLATNSALLDLREVRLQPRRPRVAYFVGSLLLNIGAGPDRLARADRCRRLARLAWIARVGHDHWRCRSRHCGASPQPIATTTSRRTSR